VPAGTAGDRVGLGRIALAYTRDGRRSEVALAEEPRVTLVADREEMLSGMQPEVWERSVAVDAVNALRRDAAQAIREGRQEALIPKIERYQLDAGALNQRFRSAEVDRQIRSLDGLVKDLRGSLAAPAAEQSRAAKTLEAEAKAGARPGTLAPAPGAK